jgi:hypothetical protein
MAMAAGGRRNRAAERHVLSDAAAGRGRKEAVMRQGSWLFAFAAMALVALPAAAQTVAPEPAPPAQQAAPPDKIGPPLHATQGPAAKVRREETTGAAPKGLKADDGTAVNPGKQDKAPPSR